MIVAKFILSADAFPIGELVYCQKFTEETFMKKTVLTFGLISGAVVAALMWIMMAGWKSGLVNFDNGEIVGYTTMIVALSMVFFGVKSYRDNNGGKISFWKGLQVGILISLISAVCYGLSWEVYYQTSGGAVMEHMEQYTTHYIEKMKEKGASADEIEATSKQMASIAEMYKNPAIRFAMTLMEILPIGIIVTLISAGLLRRKELLPAQPA